MTRTNLSFLNLLNQTQIVLYLDACFCVAFKPQLYQNLQSPQTTSLILTEKCFTYVLLRIVSLSSLDLHVRIIWRVGQHFFCNLENQSFIFPLVPLSDFVCVAFWHIGVFFWSVPTKPLSGVKLSVANLAQKCFWLLGLHLLKLQFQLCCLGWLCFRYSIRTFCRHLPRIRILELAPNRDRL